MDLAYLLQFLRELAANNTTAWMAEHRPEYQQARAAFTELISRVLAGAPAADAELAGLRPADVMFRLHKNDRGQRDPEPYKRRMGAGLKRGGRHAPRAGYYVGIQPGGQSRLWAGIFHPDTAMLGRIRQEIHYNSPGFHQILQAPALLRHFPAGLDLSVAQLSRPPRGYAATDPDLPWLKLKEYGVSRYFTDEQVLAPGFVAEVIAGMTAARPLVRFLNEALTNGE
ncbi:DUF2461 domain-containing protein [Hymenobacter saemangeumensis]|uniref:DUF2461 domain-containing protein n=1 Tax=Hymenobacter saemangeumensis TaxID=1084522 RepID=A0ABP8IT26_9BACT